MHWGVANWTAFCGASATTLPLSCARDYQPVGAGGLLVRDESALGRRLIALHASFTLFSWGVSLSMQCRHRPQGALPVSIYSSATLFGTLSLRIITCSNALAWLLALLKTHGCFFVLCLPCLGVHDGRAASVGRRQSHSPSRSATRSYSFMPFSSSPSLPSPSCWGLPFLLKTPRTTPQWL